MAYLVINLLIGSEGDKNNMKIITIVYLLIFSSTNLYGRGNSVNTVSKNKILYGQMLNDSIYDNEFEVLKKYYTNKLSLIRGEQIENMTEANNSVLFLWQLSLDHFMEKRFEKSIATIDKILNIDPTKYNIVCGLFILNKLFINNLDKIESELDTCKNINKDFNTFSHFFTEAIVHKKTGQNLEKTDRFFYENAQSFSSENEIKAYLKLAIVLNQHKKVINLLANLPPSAYESKEIRELLGFIFFRLGEFKKVSKYLQNINTVNSNNLLSTILLRDKKWDLAFARLLVSLKLNPYIETTLDRLITLTIKTKKYDLGLKYTEKKKFFLNSFNDDINLDEYKLLYIYFNLKNGNFRKAYAEVDQLMKTFRENTPDIILAIGSFLATVIQQKSVNEENYLFKSCERRNILSCYFLQTLGYFNGLNYFVEEFNAQSLSRTIKIDELKKGTFFNPIKEQVFINQKYIEELDSL